MAGHKDFSALPIMYTFGFEPSSSKIVRIAYMYVALKMYVSESKQKYWFHKLHKHVGIMTNNIMMFQRA